MIIINADDLGRNHRATDAALECFVRGRISSATAMVFMKDSARAATQALGAGLDVGLHINLSESFTDPSVPAHLREMQGVLRDFLTKSKYALLMHRPSLTRYFREVFQAQREEFLNLYGRNPSHYDGHQHLHLAANMIVGKVIPGGSKVRRSFSFERGERSRINRFYRDVVDAQLAKRHIMTDYFFALDPHVPLDRLHRWICLAETSDVELMTHPERPEEQEYLMSKSFGESLNEIKLASYSDLEPRPSVSHAPPNADARTSNGCAQ